MAWSSSAMFGAFLYQPLCAGGATGFSSLTADTVKAALYNNSITPDKTVAVASTGYNTGQWANTNECTDTNWPAGGEALSGKAFSSISGGVEYSASNVSGGGAVTMSNIYGCLVYDSSITAGTVAKQGVCFNYFGGVQQVTAGSFTIVWNANGVFQINA